MRLNAKELIADARVTAPALPPAAAKLMTEMADRLDVQFAALCESREQVKQLAAELSAVDAVHNEAVFITDDDYDKCPKRVQDIIRHLAVMQIPAYQSFVASLRAEVANELCKTFVLHKDQAGLDDDDLVTVREATDAVLHCAAQLRSQSEQVKGVQS